MPKLARRAATPEVDFLLNLTNDGWFGDNHQQWQHARTAAWRAIENRRPLVRCCNNGITGWWTVWPISWRDRAGAFHGSACGGSAITNGTACTDSVPARGRLVELGQCVGVRDSGSASRNVFEKGLGFRREAAK